MGKIFGLIILCFTYFFGFAQEEKRLQQPDIPGDIMLDLGFNSLINNSESINLGLQYSYKIGGGNTFYVRTGVKGLGGVQANEKKSISSYDLPFSTITYGVGFDRKFVNNQSIGIDYSYQSIGLLGDVSLITIRFNLF